MKRNKILLVEDQFIEAHDLELILEKNGYDVCGIARSVSQAEEMIARQKPDLVVLDIFLKGSQTGIDLAMKLKQQHMRSSSFRQIPTGKSWIRPKCRNLTDSSSSRFANKMSSRRWKLRSTARTTAWSRE